MADVPARLQPIYGMLAPDPNAEYGTVLPFARDKATGATRAAMPNALREGLGGLLDLLGGVETGQVTPRAAETLVFGGMGGGAALAPRNALAAGGARYGQGPIKAYHGSPHDFDRFDLSKIGTGEGNQAYGHGLYFAEREGTARSYRDDLAGGGFKINGRPFSPFTTQTSATTGNYAADALARFNGDRAAAIAWLRGGGGPMSQSAARLLAKKETVVEPWNGHMYEVNLHADPQRFLDWDKPLDAQQSAPVRALLDRYWSQNPRGTPTLLNYLQRPEASSAGREVGVPGIRYLDGGSRTQGQGSSNYVVFDDSIIEILRKYGLMAPAPVATTQQPTQQDRRNALAREY